MEHKGGGCMRDVLNDLFGLFQRLRLKNDPSRRMPDEAATTDLERLQAAVADLAKADERLDTLLAEISDSRRRAYLARVQQALGSSHSAREIAAWWQAPAWELGGRRPIDVLGPIFDPDGEPATAVLHLAALAGTSPASGNAPDTDARATEP